MNGRKYVFVCGLHRSGTSILGRNVGRLVNCTSFKNTGVTEDEGQFLQDVFPIDSEYGGPGRFGFDVRAHLTETSELLTPENIIRLHESWHEHWDGSKTICVEKTPANIVRTRFLQAVFPNSYFIVMRRHPLPVSMATQRLWKVNRVSLHRLFRHWLHCHELFDADRNHLRHVYELTYENYIENPHKYHEEIAAFIGTVVPQFPNRSALREVIQVKTRLPLKVPEDVMERVTKGHNERYFERWLFLLRDSAFKHYYQHVATKFECQFLKHGYSLTNGSTVEKVAPGSSTISFAIGELYCQGADAYAFFQRFGSQLKSYVRHKYKLGLLRKRQPSRSRPVQSCIPAEVGRVKSHTAGP
jgi:Sulfotransferase family